MKILANTPLRRPKMPCGASVLPTEISFTFIRGSFSLFWKIRVWCAGDEDIRAVFKFVFALLWLDIVEAYDDGTFAGVGFKMDADFGDGGYAVGESTFYGCAGKAAALQFDIIEHVRNCLAFFDVFCVGGDYGLRVVGGQVEAAAADGEIALDNEGFGRDFFADRRLCRCCWVLSVLV